MLKWLKAGEGFVTYLRVRFLDGTLDQHYQACFGSESGAVVLHDLIHASGLLDEKQLHSPEAVGAQNLVRLILKRCRVKPEHVQQIADKEIIPNG